MYKGIPEESGAALTHRGKKSLGCGVSAPRGPYNTYPEKIRRKDSTKTF